MLRYRVGKGVLKKVGLLFLGAFLIIGLQSCGGGGGGASSSKISTTKISSQPQAKNVASAVYSDSIDVLNFTNHGLLPFFRGRSIRGVTETSIKGFANLLSKFRLPNIKNLSLIYTRSDNNISEKEQCDGGGYVYYSGTSNGNNFDISIKFDNCSEGSEINSITNGDLIMKGYYNSDHDFNITFAFKTLENIDNSTSGIVYKEVISNSSLVTKMDNNTEKIIFNGELNSEISDNNSQFSGTAKYNNLTITNVETDSGLSTSVDGIVTYNVNPPDYCVGLNGTYKITTVKPLIFDLSGIFDGSDDIATSGEIHINDNVKLVWNTNGTVTVYYGNQVAYSGSSDDLYNICDFSEFF